MFTEAFPKFENSKIIRALRAYFRSVWHILTVVLLTTLSALFGLELPVYYCFALLSVLICFFGDDMLGIVPAVCCAPMTIAIKHSPSHYPGVFFGNPSVLAQIFFVAAVLVISFIARLVSSLIATPRRRLPRFTFGFIFLSVAYVLGGAFSVYYSKNTVLFGLIEAVSICFFYFYLNLTVDWKKAPKDYLATLFAAIGFSLVIQILSMYFRDGVVVDGEIYRGRLFLGWAHYNYAGAVTAMCVPAIFYFAFTKKHSWLFTLFASVVMAGVVFSQSRGSMLFGGSVYLACVVITLVRTKKRERIFNLIVLGVVLVALAVVCAVYFDKIKRVFSGIFAVGASNNGRFNNEFPEAWEYFCSNPVFGAGWGGKNWQNGYAFLKFFKAHNLVLQLLGSLGIFGFAAFAFHLSEAGTALFRRPTVEKTTIGLIVAVLLLTCMMDNHIFSFGPAISYSVLLAFLEGDNIRRGVDTRWRIKPRRKRKAKEEAIEGSAR